MTHVALYGLSIPFAVVTGCVAGLLAVLAWHILRDSPFAMALRLLVVVMALGTVYHIGLLVSGSETVLLQSLLILGYITTLAAVVAAISGFNDQGWNEGTLDHSYVAVAMVLGVLLYAVGGPLSEVYVPELLHWVHGGAALFAIVGLYTPIHDGLQAGSWNELRLTEPIGSRRTAEWMRPIDDAILDVLHSSSLVLTPAVIAYNIEYSRDEVNRRLSRLETEGLVERVERGKYRLTEPGEDYLEH